MEKPTDAELDALLARHAKALWPPGESPPSDWSVELMRRVHAADAPVALDLQHTVPRWTLWSAVAISLCMGWVAAVLLFVWWWPFGAPEVLTQSLATLLGWADGLWATLQAVSLALWNPRELLAVMAAGLLLASALVWTLEGAGRSAPSTTS